MRCTADGVRFIPDDTRFIPDDMRFISHRVRFTHDAAAFIHDAVTSIHAAARFASRVVGSLRTPPRSIPTLLQLTVEAGDFSVASRMSSKHDSAMTLSDDSSSLTETRWPRKRDRAFAAGQHSSLQAYPTLLPVHMRADFIGEGFRAAADYVVEMLATKQEHRFADMFFNPVAHNYRHFLEVSMKSLLRQAMQLEMLPYEEDTKLGHDLERLWKRTRQVIETVWPDGDPEPVLAVERIIMEFHEIDRSGQELRYAITSRGEPCLQKAPHQICLLNLRDVMSGVYHFFVGCDGGLSSLVDCQRDMRAEYGE